MNPGDSTVGVVLVSWNSLAWLPAALESVFAQTLPPATVVVVDNASSDGSVEYLRSLGPRITLLRNAGNTGFAAAANQGIHAAGASWLLVLNPDVALEPDYLERLLEAARIRPRAGALGGLLRRPDGSVDSAGLVLKRVLLRPLDRTEPVGADGAAEPCFGVCAAAALYRREMLEDIRFEGHYFDPLFFAYFEDVDLAWRCRHRGWDAYFVPAARATHVRGASGGERSHEGRLRSMRNRYLAIYKNLPAGRFLRDVALIAPVELGRMLRHPGLQLPGMLQCVRAIPSLRAWRAHIQAGARPGREWYLRP